MDHAWYARDVADLLRWRRVATAVWGSAMSILAALAYLAFARFRPTPWGVVAATLSPTEWTKRIAHALALALAQLPAHITAVALMRPSLAPLRIVGGDDDGAVDPYGGFAEPGSAGRFAASRVPPHLFPAGFGPSRWCAAPSPTNTAAAEAKDAIAHLTAFAAHVVSGAASCVALRRGAVVVGGTSEGLVHAARFGAVLGALVAAHFAGTGARNCAFPAAARPRWMRVKRCAPAAAWRGLWFSLAAAATHAGLRVALTLRGEMATADGVFSLVRVVFDFWFREVSDAVRMVPCGFACAGGWLAARAAANVVLTERYAFLPQSLADGPVSASAPLLASLVAAETPFAQHAAYRDLCAVCEDGGGGRRALLLADKRGDAYAPAMAAALAPVIAVTCAMRAALNAAERADRGVVGSGVGFGGKSGSRAAATGGGVKLRVAGRATTGAADATARPAADGVGARAPTTPAVTPTVTHSANDAIGASAGDLAGAAAWSMIADEWGVSPSAPPAAASRALDDATPPVTQGATPGASFAAATRSSAPPLGAATLTARQLRHQMERPVVAAAEECVAAIAAYGRLASWGARAAAALAGVDARGDPNGVVGARTPTAAHAVRALLAATHAARECERAGAGAFGAALGRGASSSSSSSSSSSRRRMSPRVPQLAPAAGPAAALADAFQTALFGLVSRYGGDKVRAMAAGGDPAVGEFGGDDAAGLAGLTGAARREAEIARGLRAPVELERTLDALLKWE